MSGTDERGAGRGMTHTPGPWTIPPPFSGFSRISGPKGELVFGLAAGSKDEKRSDEECEANAALISAAPDMLAVLRELLDYSGGAASALDDEYVIERAQAAIAKATGEDAP